MSPRFLVFCLLCLIFTSAHSAVEDQDWKNYLTKSCTPSLSGGTKKFFGERSFWAHTNVSMDSWAQSMRNGKPEDYCFIDYRNPSQKTQLMQCLAGYKELWDWYTRCKPVVVNACRTAGGFCN